MSMCGARIQGTGFRIQGTANLWPSPGASLAVAAIRGYQRWISPYKGYVCAHRVLHRRLSCSEFARREILTKGIRRAWSGMLEQFRECRDAASFLRTRRRETLAMSATHVGGATRLLRHSDEGGVSHGLRARLTANSESAVEQCGSSFADACVSEGAGAGLDCLGELICQGL